MTTSPASTPTPEPSCPTTKPATSKALRITGWVLSVLPALMLGMGGVMDLVQPPFVIEGLERAGIPLYAAMPLGIIVLISVALFLYPRTSVLGAILLTGYMGGAVAVHVRLEEIGLAFAPVVFAMVLWLGLVLRDEKVRAVLPIRCSSCCKK